MDSALAEWIAWTCFWKHPMRTSSLVVNARAWPDVCSLLRQVGGEFLVGGAVQHFVQYPDTVGWSSVFYGNAAVAKRMSGYIVTNDTASYCVNAPHAVVVAGGSRTGPWMWRPRATPPRW